LKNIIIGPAFPLRGGIANFNESLCNEFNKQGTNSEIVSFSLQYPKILFPGKTQYNTEGNAPEGVKISTMLNSINPFSWLKVVRYVKAQNPDYVIIRYWLPFMAPCLGFIAKRLKRNSGIKIVAITDNVIPHEKRIGDSTLTRYFVKRCDGFIAMSKSVLNDLERFTPNKHKKFIPHPVYDIFGERVSKEEAIKHLNLNSDQKHILFFGFIRKYKGLDLLLEALADMRLKELGVKLIIAGEFYEVRAYYDQIIKKHNLNDQLIMRTEFIPADEVKHYFCTADMVVQTYRSATQSGITQVAYHFDRPMLVTDVGGLAEIVPDKKVGYVCALNPQLVADAIVDFYQNERENEFVENVKQEKKRFLWSTMTDGIEELVRNL